LPRLRRVGGDEPGITRRRAGRGFTYYDAGGARVADPATLERIRGLVIPPAWQQVWICADERGHIQARGIDAKGRRQYLYHPRWRARRERAKFDHMVAFAEALPLLRRRVAEALAPGGSSPPAPDEAPGRGLDRPLDRERVLACSVRLLDLGFFRIGGEGYADENQHYGLATMLKSHVTLGEGDTVRFDYVAKAGKRQVASVVDPVVFEIVHALKHRRGGGPELLAYRQGGRWVDVRSSDINGYIKEATGGDFTAKEFRTWHATVLAAVALAVSSAVTSQRAQARAVSRAVKEVAQYLGNTPAVARSSYIDPRVIDRYRHGETIRATLEELASGPEPGGSLLGEAVERAVLAVIG
jgi:DNA topoisomerase-1